MDRPEIAYLLLFLPSGPGVQVEVRNRATQITSAAAVLTAIKVICASLSWDYFLEATTAKTHFDRAKFFFKKKEEKKTQAELLILES